MKIKFNCNGLCHLCKDDGCTNHPHNYEEQLEFAETLLVDHEELAMLENIMNPKLKQGLNLMMLMEKEYQDFDYNLSCSDRELLKYTESVLGMIQDAGIERRGEVF